jgi:hypothetical protein
MFIDDRNLGGLPDWGLIYQMISHNKTWQDIMAEEHPDIFPQKQDKKKKWWQF